VDETTRSDLDLARQALRNDWPIPPAVRRQLLQRAIDICDPDRVEYEEPVGDAPPVRKPPVPLRTVIGALKVLAQFGRLNLGQQAQDLAREKHEGKKSDTSFADVVKAGEERYEKRKHEREGRE
jgi:hypothetical protein